MLGRNQNPLRFSSFVARKLGSYAHLIQGTLGLKPQSRTVGRVSCFHKFQRIVAMCECVSEHRRASLVALREHACTLLCEHACTLLCEHACTLLPAAVCHLCPIPFPTLDPFSTFEACCAKVLDKENPRLVWRGAE